MEAIQQFLIIILVLAVLAGVLWTFQKRGWIQFGTIGLRPRADRKLQLVERLQLTPQHALCLVKLENRTILIGTAPSSCTVLHPEALS